MKARRTLAALAAAALGLAFAPAIANADTPDTTGMVDTAPAAQSDWSFHGETCLSALPSVIEGSTVPLSLCTDENGFAEGVADQELTVYATDDSNVNNLTNGTAIGSITTGAEGDFVLDTKTDEGEYIGVAPAGADAPAVIIGASPTSDDPEPTPSDSPEPTPSDSPEPTPSESASPSPSPSDDNPEPSPSETATPSPSPSEDDGDDDGNDDGDDDENQSPSPSVDPSVVVGFGDDASCDVNDGKLFEAGQTYEFRACNALGEPIEGAQINIYETANGSLADLQNGSLVETITTGANGEFSLTIPSSGYIGVIAENNTDARFIIGEDPNGGDDGREDGDDDNQDDDGNKDDDGKDDDGNKDDDGLPSTGR